MSEQTIPGDTENNDPSGIPSSVMTSTQNLTLSPGGTENGSQSATPSTITTSMENLTLSPLTLPSTQLDPDHPDLDWMFEFLTPLNTDPTTTIDTHLPYTDFLPPKTYEQIWASFFLDTDPPTILPSQNPTTTDPQQPLTDLQAALTLLSINPDPDSLLSPSAAAVLEELGKETVDWERVRELVGEVYGAEWTVEEVKEVLGLRERERNAKWWRRQAGGWRVDGGS